MTQTPPPPSARDEAPGSTGQPAEPSPTTAGPADQDDVLAGTSSTAEVAEVPEPQASPEAAADPATDHAPDEVAGDAAPDHAPDDVVEASADEPPLDEVEVDEVGPSADQPTADDAVAAQAPEGGTPDEGQSPAAPRPPVPHPGPRPGPRPTPGAVRPRPRQAARPAAVAPPAAPLPPLDPEEAARAAAFGRVADDGTVYVLDQPDERVVGQVPGTTGPDALVLYVRRYLDLQAKVALFEARLTATDLSVKEIDQTLTKLGDELAEPPVVGDLPGLRARLEGLRAVASERRKAVEAERLAAREQALAERTAIVEQAEKIAQTDPERIQWRPAGDQLRVLLDTWKDAQRNGPRLDRASEESLWKRFSHARTSFDRERRHHFAELETRNAEARAAKESIVAEAEALTTSTDWGETAGAYRDLMSRWKLAGRAARSVDDALWARFRAAQDAFFAARDAASAATDAEFAANLQVKLALLAEAETLVPIKDLAGAKSTLRSIQARWEAAGKVPRADVQRVEGRLRAVEQAVREAEDSVWRRTNPETRARAEGLAAQLEAAIAGLKADLAKATAAGDARKVAKITADLAARQAWLDQAVAAAKDSRG